MQELLDQIQCVARARNILKQTQEEKNRAFQAWKEENLTLFEACDKASESLIEAESRLRELTIQAYQQTGNKKPAPGVGIREVMKLEYDPKVALEWALDHKIALSLDKKSFESFAKATPLDFVQVRTEPQAIIASDLDAYLNPEASQKGSE